MNTTNFEIFNQISVFVLVELFEAFPSSHVIDTDKLALDAKPKNSQETREEIWKNFDKAKDTLLWLNDEGFISVKLSAENTAKFEARLTLKGLTLLGYQAPSHKKRFRSFADYAKSILEEGARGAAVDFMKQLFLQAGACAILKMATGG